MKLVTCGVLIIQDNKLFLAHSTGNDFWDLPKGLKDENETCLEAAIRETKEETGFIIEHSELNFLYQIKYNKKKDLALFQYIGTKTFCHKDAICTSLFENFQGKMLQEVDDFGFFTKEEAIRFTNKSMSKVIENLIF